MTKFLIVILIFTSGYSMAQNPWDNYRQQIEEEVDGQTAYDATAYVEQFWRLAGNPGFDSSILYIVKSLENAGYVYYENENENGNENGDGNGDGNGNGNGNENENENEPLMYTIEKRPLPRPAWEPLHASIFIEGESTPVLTFSGNRNMIAINSYSTETTAPVIFIENIRHLASLDVAGKIVMADIHPYYLYNAAVVEFGAAGILSFSMPDYLQPDKNTTSIQFQSIPYRSDPGGWALALSYEARENIKQALKNGPVTLKVKIETAFHTAEELTVIARVRGSRLPDEELVISAHVQEPGANDNASGVGAALEMAVATANLIHRGEFNPWRTLTFLWGDEIVSTRRYVEEAGENIRWGFSLDMVGQNTSLTGGTFLIEKMPDPSAIWTRGKDQHTEWGAGDVNEDDILPHYLNTFVTARFMEQGERAGWKVSTNPFEGGSDHVPFLKDSIPAVLFWHFTDQFYHTDQDRLDKVSKETLRNVITGSMITTYMLLNGDASLGEFILSEMAAEAFERLGDEAALSKTNIANGGDPTEQEQIINSWINYYIEASLTVSDLCVAGESLNEQIRLTQGKIRQVGNEALAEMQK